jgi:DHA3 family macrolide efflux protein-like MFS transporter
MLKALRHPPIRRLWFGQALSTIGDEIYRVALTWMLVGVIGADVGYLTAAQAAALMALSFVGGKWAEHWDSVHTLVYVDAIRGLIVLIPVAYSFFAPVPLSLLVLVALTIAALGAFFDPALQASLPRFSPDIPTLRASTGLMATTIRMARLIGPIIIGLLSGIMPPIHFFSIDALTFFISAASVKPLAEARKARMPRPSISYLEAILAGFKSLKQRPGMGFILLSKALTTASWALGYGLGFALLVQELTPNSARSFGWVMASYGIGNFAGSLYFGNRLRPRPALMMFIGYIWFGIGFVLVANAPTIRSVMVAAAFTGFSGIMNEVTFFDLVQTRFPLKELPRIVRLRLATDTAATLVLTLISPFLFHWLTVRTVIAMCGVIWVTVGITGLSGFRKVDDSTDCPSHSSATQG